MGFILRECRKEYLSAVWLIYTKFKRPGRPPCSQTGDPNPGDLHGRQLRSLRDCSEFLVRGGGPFAGGGGGTPRGGVSIFYTHKKKKNKVKYPFRAIPPLLCS